MPTGTHWKAITTGEEQAHNEENINVFIIRNIDNCTNYCMGIEV